MLARAANNIFWMARYVERAEAVARLLAASSRGALLPAMGEGARLSDWHAPLLMTGSLQDFIDRYGEVTEGRVLSYMILDRVNSSSIRSSLAQARENARATRHLLTSELWEGLNQTWLGIADLAWKDVQRTGVGTTLEWVRDRSHMFLGCLNGSMRRGEAFWFACLGGALERADNTARLLRVKWPWLQPSEQAGRQEATLFYRGAVLLESFSAYQAYREIYSASIQANLIAELLILRSDIPCSLAANIDNIAGVLQKLDAGEAPLARARALGHRLRSVKTGNLMRTGLDTFLGRIIEEIAGLATLIQTDFRMVK